MKEFEQKSNFTINMERVDKEKNEESERWRFIIISSLNKINTMMFLQVYLYIIKQLA